MQQTVSDTQLVAAIKRTKRKRVAAAILLVAFCFIAGISGGAITSLLVQDASPLSFAQEDGNTVMTEGEQTIASVAERVSPSVVSIITSTRSARSFTAEQAAGTGMIISADGYVLTNKHVVSGADTVTVVTSEGKTYDQVRVVGSDPLNDVAFLKISNVKNLPSITIGDSKTVRTGQSVIAIGNALGQYQNTVTSGIISGLGRPVIASTDGRTTDEAESLTDLLQTDAAINSGNSGGPLLNLQGQVIGINTAVAQDANSVGFAIPIGATKGLMKHLIETGKVERAFIGVQYISITPEVRQEYGLSVTQGDYIKVESGSAIRAGSPADKAGLMNNDIITKVNDQEIGPGRSVSTLVGEYQPGDTLRFTILRDGKAITKQVQLAAY